MRITNSAKQNLNTEFLPDTGHALLKGSINFEICLFHTWIFYNNALWPLPYMTAIDISIITMYNGKVGCPLLQITRRSASLVRTFCSFHMGIAKFKQFKKARIHAILDNWNIQTVSSDFIHVGVKMGVNFFTLKN